MKILITKPSSDDLNALLLCLKIEFDDLNEGFYCHSDIIEKCYHAGNLILFSIENEFVGFMAFRECGIALHINIFEILPEFRGKSIGKYFFQKCSEYFVARGILVAELDSNPISSLTFWKNMGFINCPIGSRNGYSKGLFKPLINSCSVLLGKSQDAYFEIEGYGEIIRWDFEASKENRIIFPCTSQFTMRLVEDEQILEEESVKYFLDKSVFLDEYLVLLNTLTIET